MTDRMSNERIADLSAEAAEELRGQLICQCNDVYRHRNLHSPDCLYHLEPNLDVLVNEIARLRAEIAAENARLKANNERLKTALSDLVSWFATPSQYGPWIIKAGEHGVDAAVEAARAALADGGTNG